MRQSLIPTGVSVKEIPNFGTQHSKSLAKSKFAGKEGWYTPASVEIAVGGVNTLPNLKINED